MSTSQCMLSSCLLGKAAVKTSHHAKDDKTKFKVYLKNKPQTLSPVSLQGSAMAKQLGAEAYLECSAFTSEKSIHSVFRTAAMACINKLQALPKPSPTRRLSKRLLHLPSRSDLLSSTFKKEKAKSCSVMWDGEREHPLGFSSHMWLPIPSPLVLGKGGWAWWFYQDYLLNPSLTPPGNQTTLRRGGHLAVHLLLNFPSFPSFITLFEHDRIGGGFTMKLSFHFSRLFATTATFPPSDFTLYTAHVEMEVCNV